MTNYARVWVRLRKCHARHGATMDLIHLHASCVCEDDDILAGRDTREIPCVFVSWRHWELQQAKPESQGGGRAMMALLCVTARNTIMLSYPEHMWRHCYSLTDTVTRQNRMSICIEKWLHPQDRLLEWGGEVRKKEDMERGTGGMRDRDTRTETERQTTTEGQRKWYGVQEKGRCHKAEMTLRNRETGANWSKEAEKETSGGSAETERQIGKQQKEKSMLVCGVWKNKKGLGWERENRGEGYNRREKHGERERKWWERERRQWDDAVNEKCPDAIIWGHLHSHGGRSLLTLCK